MGRGEVVSDNEMRVAEKRLLGQAHSMLYALRATKHNNIGKKVPLGLLVLHT